MIVVSDSSPILNRSAVDKLHLLREMLGKNQNPQAKPPAPPMQVVCCQWWGRRFRLPRPLAADFYTASDTPPGERYNLAKCSGSGPLALFPFFPWAGTGLLALRLTVLCLSQSRCRCCSRRGLRCSKLLPPHVIARDHLHHQHQAGERHESFAEVAEDVARVNGAVDDDKAGCRGRVA